MKVLIVEDNIHDRKILKYNFENRGYSTIEASNGKEALERAMAEKPDLIISDALMPEMDGFELLRAIKSDAALKDVPFVFYSAVYTGLKEELLAISLGAEAFIVKPKEPDEFWHEIVKIIDNSKLKKKKDYHALHIREDEVFLRSYSKIVAAKLEDKVNELTKAIQKIELTEIRYTNLFSSIRDVIIITDEERTIVEANQPALRNMFGYESDEVIGKNTRILFANEEDYRDTGLAVFDARQYIVDKIFEVLYRRKDGEIFTGELHANKFIDKFGTPIGNVGVIRDITDRKNLEMQLINAQKMEAIGCLAGGIAHDFNNILTAIIGYCALSKMHMREDDPQQHYIGQILSLSERAASLTSGLLAFSRKQVINLQSININDVIQRIEKLLVRMIGEDISLKMSIKDSDLNIFADSIQIEQVLFNLATNARDAMPDGGSLFITTEKFKIDRSFIDTHGFGKEGEYALTTVSDSGHGIESATMQRIFEPLFTTKDVGKGTGLGLSIVYGIVKQHNGFINVYSEKDKGTTFRIYLPLINEGVKKTQEATEHVSPIGGHETILIVEDDANIRNVSRIILENFGYKVLEAADGEEAIAKFIDNKDAIKLVLLDVIMPKKSGKEVFEEISKIKPEIKTLFMSGYPNDIINSKGFYRAGLEFIQKPSSPYELLRRIREILDKK